MTSSITPITNYDNVRMTFDQHNRSPQNEFSAAKSVASTEHEISSEGDVSMDLFRRLSCASSAPTIPEFYSNSSVFITGVTGFLGKSILEKLLRSCPQIEKIFVLVRSKKGHNPFERVESLFESKLFDRVQTEQGAENCRNKVVAIAGDVLEPNLGISEADEQILISSNVTTVIHSAATIKFDEPLRFALALNVGGTLKVIELCKKLPNLKALVHVSTAYANCDLPYIEEQVYPPPVDPHKLLDALNWMSDEAASKITPVLLGSKPNTYTYTKHLAENLLIEEAGSSLPYIIVRPSIVGASWREPFAGWIDNFNGPSGLFIACGMGLLRSMIGKPDAIADIVPVDIVSNVIIAAPWYRATVIYKQMQLSLSTVTKSTPTDKNNNTNKNKQRLVVHNNNTTTAEGSLQVEGQRETVKFADNRSDSISIHSEEAENSAAISNEIEEPDSSSLSCSSAIEGDSSSDTSDRKEQHSVMLEKIQSSNANPSQPIIVNCTSGYVKMPIKWGELPITVARNYIRNPISKAMRYPNCKITGNKWMYFLWVFTCHRVPALLMDTYMRIIGKKPRMMSMYRKLHISMDTLSFFTQRNWKWEVNALKDMQNVINGASASLAATQGQGQKDSNNNSNSSPSWGKDWNTSVTDIDWSEYLEMFCIGTKCFVLNEEMSDLHIAKKRMSRLKTLHYLFNIFTAAIVWRMIMLKSEVACKLWNMFVQFCFKWLDAMRLTRFVTL